ncbi:MAG: helix-turn-helix transcriptional regulator [Lachnospiraceae bacterium]|nr:helix-turn-helix transcriptional regulator [Lachnospiraceae bacterium]
MNKKKISENLLKLRLKNKKTQKEVADAIGVAVSTYGMYEIGKRIPNDENKRKIASFFGTTVQAIFFN